MKNGYILNSREYNKQKELEKKKEKKRNKNRKKDIESTNNEMTW